MDTKERNKDISLINERFKKYIIGLSFISGILFYNQTTGINIGFLSCVL